MDVAEALQFVAQFVKSATSAPEASAAPAMSLSQMLGLLDLEQRKAIVESIREGVMDEDQASVVVRQFLDGQSAVRC